MLPGSELLNTATQAASVYQTYAAQRPQFGKRPVRKFAKAFPDEARALIRFYDASRPGLNHFFDRRLTRSGVKVAAASEMIRLGGVTPKLSSKRSRPRTTTVAILAGALLTPMLLAPTHPIAVYGYLADVYASPLIAEKAYAAQTSHLPEFLTSFAQVQRYKLDLFEDMLDTNTGKLFAIVRRPDGTLRQEAIRTWNGFLPAGLPSSVSSWLDRKEIPFLGDEVALWLEGDTIEAHGHYHSYGGPPSPGDLWMQQYSSLPEVVISNGVIPMVYLNGKLTPYGHGARISPRVFKAMRALEDAMVMNGSQEPCFPDHPTAALKSVLGYLHDYRGVDTAQLGSVARAIKYECEEFKDEYCAAFPKGFQMSLYQDDADTFNFLSKVQILHGWATVSSAPRWR